MTNLRRTSLRYAALAAAAVFVSSCANERATAPIAPSYAVSGSGGRDFPILVTPQSDNGFIAATDGKDFLVVTLQTDPVSGAGVPGTQLVAENGVRGPAHVLGAANGDLGVVAFDGARYLAAFQNNGVSDLDGQFVGRDGEFSGPDFHIQSTDPQDATGVSVWGIGYGAGKYLIAYSRNYGTLDNPIDGVFVRTVSTSGDVGPERQINPTGSDDVFSSVAFDGSNFLVEYVYDAGDGSHVAARFVSPSSVLGGVVDLADGTPENRQVALGFNGTNYLATWDTHAAVGGPLAVTTRAVTPAGALVGSSNTIALSGGNGHPNWITTNDAGDFLLSFQEGLQSASSGGAQFVGGDGTLLGSAFTVIAPDASATATGAYLFSAHNNRFFATVMKRTGGPGTWDLYGRYATYRP